MSLLEIAGLRLSFGAMDAVKGVSLHVGPGEVLGLIGESGSGKSLTALAAIGLAPQSARMLGSIRLKGRELTTLTERQMTKVRGDEIGMIFQEPMTALNPLMTIGDQVAETARVHGLQADEAAERARAALERVGLDPARISPSRYPHELSGGQRQRVCAALATALRPDLLIADEPTTALDVTTQAQVLRLLRGFVDREGMGMVFITHDLGVVAGLADRIAIMRHGEIVEEGATHTVFRAMRHPYTRRLAEAATHQPPKVQTPPGPVALEAVEVVRAYPGRRSGLFSRTPPFRAVDGVSLQIRRGETLGLVGESGCGKSTLMRALLGLEPVQTGEVRIGGETFSGLPPRHLRRRAQAVFQDPYGSFNPRWRVESLVTEPLHLLDEAPSRDDRRARAEKALAEVGIKVDALDRFPHEFSGGQRQRIAIARALIVEPEVVVLDEAVSALDVSVRAQVLDLLTDLKARLGLGYLFITHDLGVVRAISDRIVVMRAGRIVEQAETESLFAAPQDPYTQDLLAASPSLKAALEDRHE